MAKILPFEQTMFTKQREIHRICKKDEKALIQRAAWMLEFEDPGGWITEEDRERYIRGDYEI